jgi:hypothetical protein
MAARRRDVAPLVKDLVDWMTRERAKLSRHNDVAKAMDYMLTRLDDFTRFLEDGRICLTNNAAASTQGNRPGQKIVVYSPAPIAVVSVQRSC